MTAELQTPSVLAFERKLDVSDALLYSGSWDRRHLSDKQEWTPVEVREKSVRGTISNRLKTKDSDPAKLDASIQKPNLQTVDVAMLTPGCDTVQVRFSLRVLGDLGKPSVCNKLAYQQKLQNIVQGYIAQYGLRSLAQRYAHNIANARFLWRNRVGAEMIEVRVAHRKGASVIREWQFNAHDYSLRCFTEENAIDTSLNELAQLIASGLTGEAVFLDIIAFAKVGNGQEVFPSQELILSRSADKSKTLYKVQQVAAIHSQKIGNALRTIDDWYSGAEEIGPIPVEPYGSVTTLGKAFRQPKEKMDFYSLLDRWVLRDQAPEIIQQHFVMANLIRGGVFGESEKD